MYLFHFYCIFSFSIMCAIFLYFMHLVEGHIFCPAISFLFLCMPALPMFYSIYISVLIVESFIFCLLVFFKYLCLTFYILYHSLALSAVSWVWEFHLSSTTFFSSWDGLVLMSLVFPLPLLTSKLSYLFLDISICVCKLSQIWNLLYCNLHATFFVIKFCI